MAKITFMTRRQVLVASTAGAFSAATGTSLYAQDDFPSKPIRVFVPYAPGNPNAVLQHIGQDITDGGGPQIVLENKPGAGAIVAAMALKGAPADGYTLMLIDSSQTIYAALNKKVPYDLSSSFVPVVMLWSFPSVLTVSMELNAKTFHEFVVIARTRPGGITYASQGVGTTGHLLGALLSQSLQIPMTHVPYRSGGAARIDLFAGRVDLIFTSPTGVSDLLTEGKIRILGVTGDRRLNSLPDVPTMAELSQPSVDYDTWFGLVSPEGLKDAVVLKLHEMFGRAARSAEFLKFAEDQSLRVNQNTSTEFGDIIRRDLERTRTIVQSLGIEEQ